MRWAPIWSASAEMSCEKSVSPVISRTARARSGPRSRRPATPASRPASSRQQYSYSLFLPEDSGTLRFDTFWLEVRVIGLDIPDTFALDMSISMMGNTADQVDAWVAARGR
ncbi:MAG: hypothetical protein KC621_11240 [Myxococcales bacterium]|nr:hypothetical protein [Myxococcales bacterium]